MRTLAALLVLSLASGAAAEAGRTGGAILQRKLGARAAGMGRAFASVAGEPEGIWYNPASASGLARPAAAATYLAGFAGSDHGLLTYAHPAGPFAFMGSVQHHDAGRIQLNLTGGGGGTVTAERDSVFAAGAAFRPHERLALGVLVKHARFELGEAAKADGTFFDAGVQARGPWGLRLGAALQNIGSDITFEAVGDPPPRTLRAGASRSVEFDPPNLLDRHADLVRFVVLLSGDYEKVRFDDGRFQAGLELSLQTSYSTLFHVRAGYLFDRPAETFTAGFGVPFGRWSLDYAVGGAGFLGTNHQFTLGCSF